MIGDDGRVLGEGWHARYGEEHAERIALRHAAAKGGYQALQRATLFVNLEPCSHQGKTPPCTQAIIESGVGRVVAGMRDPNPEAAGGAALLRQKGVDVTVGVLEARCRRFNEPFIHSTLSRRPLVTVKIAQTIDGRMAAASGQSQWITGPEARTLVHRWRADADGILVGSGTARVDDPSLTVRHVPGPHPWRFVLDRRGTLPSGLRLFSDGRPTTVVTGQGVQPCYEASLLSAGGSILRVSMQGGHLDLGAALALLPVQSLLVEAGPGLASALMQQGLVDRFFVFLAPKVLGSGPLALDGFACQTLEEAITFEEHRWEQVGRDMLLRGFLRPH